MIDPGFIDEIKEEYVVQKNPGVLHALEKIQKQWAADLEAYQVLESRYRSTVENIEMWTAHATEEIKHIRDVREMRTR